MMVENHEREQYFFDEATVKHLANFASGFSRPCCLCAPMVGQELEAVGVDVRILDIDERFASLRGFRRYDISRPEWMGEQYGLIICDPPFFSVSLTQLLKALHTLSQYNVQQPLLISYLTRRADALRRVFQPFALCATGFQPGYRAVQATERNEIEFYGNLGVEAHARLAGVAE